MGGMKVRVDATNCQGYGSCKENAPELFELDEWGFASVTGDGEVPAGQEGQAQEAVRACPARAITAE
jgi:ferredoxin